MLITASQFEEHLLAHDLVAAARAQQDCARRLFYCYDRANKTFTGEAGQVDPETVHRGLVAVAAGIKMLCVWLREIGENVEGPFTKEANDMWDWCEEWFYNRSLPMSLDE